MCVNVTSAGGTKRHLGRIRGQTICPHLGSGSAGRAVASNCRGPRFESSYSSRCRTRRRRSAKFCKPFVDCVEKTKMKKKRPEWPLLMVLIKVEHKCFGITFP